MDTVRHPYHLKWQTALWLNGLCLVMAVAGAYAAMTNRDAWTIDGLIEFSPSQSNLMFGVCAAVFAVFLLIGLRAAFHDARQPGELVITADTLTAKSAPWREPTTVRFADVHALKIQVLRRTRFLHIEYPGGRLAIHSLRLPDKGAFDQVCRLVGERAARQKPTAKPGTRLPPDP